MCLSAQCVRNSATARQRLQQSGILEIRQAGFVVLPWRGQSRTITETHGAAWNYGNNLMTEIQCLFGRLKLLFCRDRIFSISIFHHHGSVIWKAW